MLTVLTPLAAPTIIDDIKASLGRAGLLNRPPMLFRGVLAAEPCAALRFSLRVLFFWYKLQLSSRVQIPILSFQTHGSPVLYLS